MSLVRPVMLFSSLGGGGYSIVDRFDSPFVTVSQWLNAAWATEAASLNVASNATAIYGANALEVTQARSGRSCILWTQPFSGVTDNMEVLVRQWSSNSAYNEADIVALASIGSARIDYRFAFRGGAGEIKILRDDDQGEAVVAQDLSFTSFDTTTPHFIRLRREPGQLMGKIWQGSYTNEPSSWTLSGSVSGADGVFPGVFGFNSAGTHYLDFISVTIDGSTAGPP